MTVFQKGDRVWFIDKYDRPLSGVFDGPCVEDPDFVIVIARPFADVGGDYDVRCMVPLEALHREVM